MEFQVTAANEFVPAPRSPRTSAYDPLVDELIKLPEGKVIVIPTPKGENSKILRIRIRSAICARMLARDCKFSLGCTLSADGDVGLRRLDAQKPARKAKKASR
jgi:hypothetical protein